MSEEQTSEQDQDQQFVQVSKVTRRSDEFESLYANNILFESNPWNLNMIFGELKSKSDGEPEIEQHTSISIPWSVAKIACFYLALNIIGFEETNGPNSIQLTPAMLGMLRLNERAKKDHRIVSIFTSLMHVGNPELFSRPVTYVETPTDPTSVAPAPEDSPQPPASPEPQA